MNEERNTPANNRRRTEVDGRGDDTAARIFSQVVTTAVEDAMARITHKGAKTNVAVFVDYDNVYWTLMNRYRHDPDHEDPARNLFDRIWEQYGLDN
ncbi:MAG: NYN domain-containing protein, partial [Firmicutes bacterium]|nr:NYN domain-containing protein [Bacillota bacterium]